jgi:hypothetical protein
MENGLKEPECFKPVGWFHAFEHMPVKLMEFLGVSLEKDYSSYFISKRWKYC